MNYRPSGLLSETARPLTDNSHPRAMADLFNPLEEADVSRATIDEEDERIAEDERAEAGDGPKVFGVVRALITETANAFTGPNPNPRLPRSSSATSPTPNHSGTQEYALQFLQVAFPAASRSSRSTLLRAFLRATPSGALEGYLARHHHTFGCDCERHRRRLKPRRPYLHR